jgi:hypothetical protein
MRVKVTVTIEYDAKPHTYAEEHALAMRNWLSSADDTTLVDVAVDNGDMKMIVVIDRNQKGFAK